MGTTDVLEWNWWAISHRFDGDGDQAVMRERVLPESFKIP